MLQLSVRDFLPSARFDSRYIALPYCVSLSSRLHPGMLPDRTSNDASGLKLRPN